MTTNVEKQYPFDAGPGFLPVLGLGALLAYMLVGDIFLVPLHHLVVSLCIGFAWAYLFLQWVDILAETISLTKDPIPLTLAVGDRGGVADHLKNLRSRQTLVVRARHLLEAWREGWNPQQILGLVGYQNRQLRAGLISGAIFVVVLIWVGIGLNGNPKLTWPALVLLALMVLARQELSSQIESYLERHLLIRLPTNIPQTAMTAKELADELGGAINNAFKNYIPQPEATAAAMKGAVADVVKQAAVEVEKLEQKLVQAQSMLVKDWMQAATTTTSDLKNVEKALGSVVTDLTGGLRTYEEKLGKALGQHTEQVGKLGGIWSEQLKGALSGHAEKIQAANQALASQLDKIMTLEKDIQQVLHVQEVVDGTLKAVTTTEEFKQTLSALRTHLQESDKLLREVSKPRRIRLVESERSEQ